MPINLPQTNSHLTPLHPSAIIQWSLATFGTDLLMTSSFGSESMCLIHLATQLQPDLRILVINTGFLFPETLAFLAEMRAKHHLNILEYRPLHDPFAWLTIHGEPDPTRRQNVDACCAANKNEPFDRAMREQHPAAWLRGVRADQSVTRSQMQIVQWSQRHNCYAISPLLHWTPRDIHAYMKQHNLPYHPLWEKGYTSIGCSPETCTRPITLGEDPRSGRWSNTAKKECGLHLEPPPPFHNAPSFKPTSSGGGATMPPAQ